MVQIVEILKAIVTNVLTAFYQPFGFSVLLAVFFMFAWLLSEQYGGGLEGWKKAFLKWWEALRSRAVFRRHFVLAFYTSLMLFRTLLNRELWLNPLSNVMGGWRLIAANGEITTDSVENVILFIPFTFLLFYAMRKRIVKGRLRFLAVAGKATEISFLCSLSIETAQLLFRIGTFQLADLFYNTLGGLIGGMIYWIVIRLSRHNRR